MEISFRRTNLSQPTNVSTFAIRTANAQTKNCKRASIFASRRKNYFSKSLPSKFFKTANTQAKQTETELII
jgi:hypothetical protein